MSGGKPIRCRGCGWDGEVRIWGGRFAPYTVNAPAPDDQSDPMKRPRALPRSWRGGYCAHCVWKQRKAWRAMRRSR